jgi:hypothetical protein
MHMAIQATEHVAMQAASNTDAGSSLGVVVQIVRIEVRADFGWGVHEVWLTKWSTPDGR